MRLTKAAFVLLGFIWGSNFIYMKWAVTLISPMQIAFLRVLFGFLPLALAAWHQGVINRSQLRHLPHFFVMAAVATVLYYVVIVKGTALLPSGVAGVLGGSIAIFTAIFSLLLLRTEKVNGLMVVGVVLGFAGIVLTARPWKGADNPIDLAGVFWMLAGSIILGMSYVYVRRFLSPFNLPPLALVAWQMGLALLMLAVLTDFTGIGHILHDWQAAAGVVVGLGILGTGIAFLIYYFLLQELGAVAASGSTYITPTVALLIGWVAGEKVGVLEVTAIALILASIAMLQIGRQRAARETAQSVRVAAARP
ncbi:DMT family transporter [Caballeronia sp. SEWSISQ10-4 2]|uniref:DMT family transporter n=1 Tax=Caballeronia sp. SEWSISQ10-4 2 TaxID=2937438 RepID=UPI0026559C9B|nr:DMT family transporter [Caballeronia sp. SEWSISQ10-4 2]MDN7179731.1 DMT family transporter [Caballeronia sp. SEWSISQ10-4 2]